MTTPDITDRVRDYVNAWNAADSNAVAAFFAPDAHFTINRGDPCIGRDGIAEMATGFFTDVPDLRLKTDILRVTGDRALHAWTFTGHHVEAGHALDISGWEEWDLASDGLIRNALGWYDADAYARQIAGA